MYSIDLEKISLDEFEEILSSIDLLPGGKILSENLPKILARYQQASLGLKDVKYCKRFCRKLDLDIEW